MMYVILPRDAWWGRYDASCFILEEKVNALTIFAGMLAENGYECAPWYKAFIESDAEKEVWSMSSSVRKDGNDVIIGCRCQNRSPLTFTLGQEEFLKALDRWCELVIDHPDRIIVEWDGVRIAMHGQDAGTDAEVVVKHRNL